MDIMDALALELPCAVCHGTYRLPLKNIELSQQPRHPDCPADPRECPTDYYQTLLDKDTLLRLRAVWNELQQQARGINARLVLESGPRPQAPGAPAAA